MYTRNIAVSVGAVALAVALMLLPGRASAVPVPPPEPGPCSTITTGQSDCLQVTFDSTTLHRTLLEVPGESVTDEIAFSGATGFTPGPDSFAYLVEPGSLNTTTGLGIQSDKVTLHVSADNGVTLHFTLGSDENPGRANLVAGLVEDGSLQNVTSTLFPGASCVLGVCTVGTHTITVLVRSDPTPVPEPTSLLLLGSGLTGLGLLGLWRRSRRRGAQA